MKIKTDGTLGEIVAIQAHFARLNCRVAGMQAENEFRSHNGNGIAYGDEAFEAELKEFDEAIAGSVES